MSAARIELDQDIQPLSEFRKNTAYFIDRIRVQKRSIVLTQHGKSAAVLVDVSEYQRMVNTIDLLEEFMAAEKQMTLEEVKSNRQANIKNNTDSPPEILR